MHSELAIQELQDNCHGSAPCSSVTAKHYTGSHHESWQTVVSSLTPEHLLGGHDGMMAELAAYVRRTLAQVERTARMARSAAKQAHLKMARPAPRTPKARKFPELDLMAAIIRDVQAKEARRQRASLRARRRSKYPVGHQPSSSVTDKYYDGKESPL